MTDSNTKLTADDKEFLRDLKHDNPNVLLKNNGETVMAYQDKGNTVEFSLSVCAPTEKKFRRKVGELHALNRFLEGCTVKMARGDFYRMCDEVYLFE